MTDFTHRIHGTEMEWGAMTSTKEDSENLTLVMAAKLAPHVRSALHSQGIRFSRSSTMNFYLSNGSRFYNDVEERWEYCTPEDNSFIGTTANEFASEVILQRIADSYAEGNNGQPLSLTKRVIDDDYVGCGYHASYCVDSRNFSITENSLALFGAFAATRGVLFGSGALLPDGNFLTAQKAATVTLGFSSGTTHFKKPVVNLRQEPLADSQRFLRMHDTSGDPSVSPWANRVKLGAASLVLRLIEHDIKMPELAFHKTITDVSRSVAEDSNLRGRYKLTDGTSVTALEVQRAIVNKVYKLSKEVSLSEEEEWTLEEWDRAISDLGQNPNLTTKRVEWVARRKILERYKNKHGISWKSDELRYKDIQFSEVVLNGIVTSLRETLWSEYMPDETLIADRVNKAPKTTRAHARSEFIKFALKRSISIQDIDWSTIKIDGKYHYLPNPYDYSHPGLVELRATT